MQSMVSHFTIFAGAPYVERLRHNQALRHALSAIGAAVVGVILNLADGAAVQGMAAAAQGRTARVHVEVDTGMGRLGVAPDEAMALADAARDAGLEVAGLMTHFATADEREGPEAGFMREHMCKYICPYAQFQFVMFDHDRSEEHTSELQSH